MFKQVFYGACTDPANRKLKDLSFREIAVLVPLVLLIFWIGLFPRPYLRVIEPPVASTVQRVQRHAYQDYESSVVWEKEALPVLDGKRYFPSTKRGN